MQIPPPIRLAEAIFCILLPAHALLAQARPKPIPAPSTLPAIQPTAQPATPTPPPPPPTPAQQPPQPARIAWADNTLSVEASNSSLNQILRDISRQTGIKITGSIPDERVFGQYGPGTTAQVLAALLNGTSGNMLLIQGDAATPSELILTPRTGAATPPNPNAARDEEPEYHAPPPPPDQPEPAPIQNQPATPAAGTPSANGTQPQSPNGAKTPQQIYDELQRLRAQQQQQQTAQPQ